ncbi:MAG: endonuclease NucS domain-containing protein [Nitrospirota bacterium]
MNLLIPYVYLYHHPDPLFEEFTYGEAGSRARKIKKDLKKGDYVFFHTSIGGRKYMTAYYVVDRVLDTTEVIQNKNITAKYRNPHISEFNSSNKKDDVILFGDPITSRILKRPLLFNKTLSEKLSLNIKFQKGKTETQVIGSATRAHRKLSKKDVDILLKSFSTVEDKAIGISKVLSTDEVTEIIEKDIEGFIEKNSSLLEKSLVLKRRQMDTPVGRIDLLFEDMKGNPIVVELKLNRIGRDAVNQLRKYMMWISKETKKDVKGAIVCKGVMPAFEEDLKKLTDIKIFSYGWQLVVSPWKDQKIT